MGQAQFMQMNYIQTEKSTKDYVNIKTLLIPFFLAVLLVTVSFYNFLLFHTLAEFFAITIAILMCVVAWHMYPFTKNNYLMYLGGGYFWIGVLDLLHTLSYKGIGVFPEFASVDGGVQFWIGTRYLEALLLLSAPWFLTHRLYRMKSFSVYGLLAFLIVYLVLNGYFPQSFVEGKGLTAFKIYSEYIIIGLLALSIYYLLRQRVYLERNIVNVIVLSIILTMCAELAFTFYIDLYGISNLIGHVFKLFSFWLIFVAVIRTTLQEPFLVMSKGATTYDAVPDATIVIDDEGIIRQANVAACKLSSFSLEELIGKNNHDVFHSKRSTKDDCYICQAISEGKAIDCYEMAIDNKRWYDFSLSGISNTTGKEGTVEVIRDISKRKLVEQDARVLDLLKNSIVENLPDILFVKDAKGHHYVEWNKAAEDLTGIAKEEILGETDFKFWPKEQAQFFIEKDNEVIKDRKLLDIPEEPLSTKTKGTRTLHTKKIPIYDDEGNPKYLLGISEDITDKLKTNALLNRSQKLEAIGQMSGGIAHDFNNQLAIIQGYINFFDKVDLQEKQRGWLSQVQSATQRCIDLTRQLMIFSRSGEVDKDIINANDVINKMHAMIKSSLTPEVRIEYNLSDNLWMTEVNEGALQDVILNMVLNSRDAMPKGGTFYIKTKNIILDENDHETKANLQPGEYICITVTDSGEGMREDVCEHIFEPFYTTKDVGKGTGLGLAMVYGFVHRYGGEIVVNSEIGKGATFNIYLPRVVETTINEQANNSGDTDVRGGTENVLVVEDEASLLSLAEINLKDLGYHVFCAASAVEALKILEEESIDLLFTDIIMPGGMNGYELASKCLAMQPRLKVLVTSGFEDKDEVKHNGFTVDFKIIPKPYNVKKLAEMLRKVLDE